MTISANYPSIRPSLLLDFANGQALDSRINFTRAGTGTYYDGETSAVAEQNLLLRSQDFSNAVWQTVNVTKGTITDTRPDGTTGTVDTITFSSVAAGQISFVVQTVVSSQLNIQYTDSVYVKVASGTATIFLNLLDTASAPSGGNTVAGSAQTVTTSWTRISLTGTRTSGSQTHSLCIGFDTRANAAQTNASSLTLQVWGGQAEQHTGVGVYVPTTTTAITNYIPQLLTAVANQPRFDFNPVTRQSLGLLMEQQSTNLLTYSEQFDNGVWTKSNSTITANANVAPDGTLTADKLVAGTGTGTQAGFVAAAAISTSATPYTITLYVKYAELQYFQIWAGGSAWSGNANFDLVGNTVTVQSGCTATMQSVGNNWFRLNVTFTATAATIQPWFSFVSTSTAARASTYTGNGYSGIYIWGAQLEATAFPTSYIPTGVSQGTRTQDFATITGTNFSSWFNSQQGTVYCSFDSATLGAPITGYWGIDNNITLGYLIYRGGGTTLDAYSGPVGANIGTISAIPTGSLYTNAQQAVTTYNNILPMTASGSLNGATAVSASSPTQVAYLPTQLSLGKYLANTGAMTGHIRKFAYYPIASTSAQLQALTGS